MLELNIQFLEVGVGIGQVILWVGRFLRWPGPLKSDTAHGDFYFFSPSLCPFLLPSLPSILLEFSGPGNLIPEGSSLPGERGAGWPLDAMFSTLNLPVRSA